MEARLLGEYSEIVVEREFVVEKRFVVENSFPRNKLRPLSELTRLSHGVLFRSPLAQSSVGEKTTLMTLFSHP